MRSLYKAVFSVALSAMVLSPLSYAQRDGHEERGPYSRARDLIDRVQQDDKLSRGEFDKDKLDTAIDDVNNVLKNNVLSPRSRHDLRDDLDALRSMREARGRI
jgi:hypothetical protein